MKTASLYIYPEQNESDHYPRTLETSPRDFEIATQTNRNDIFNPIQIRVNMKKTSLLSTNMNPTLEMIACVDRIQTHSLITSVDRMQTHNSIASVDKAKTHSSILF